MNRPRAVLDSSTLVARFTEARGFDHVRVDELLEGRVVMSAINWSEAMSAFYQRSNKPKKIPWPPEVTDAAFRRNKLIGDAISVQPFGDSEAVATAVAHRALRDADLAKENPGIGDVACLSLARSLSLPVVTSDARWLTFGPALGVAVEYLPIPRR